MPQPSAVNTTVDSVPSPIGTIGTLFRYPVKSMLGEEIREAVVTTHGIEMDRVLALIDNETGRVASAKQPRLWRTLLQCSASWHDTHCSITLPQGDRYQVSIEAPTGDGSVDRALSSTLDRAVHMSANRPVGATIARPSPEDVIEHGQTAKLPYEMIQLGQATPGTTFVDYAPVSVFTSSTLAHLGVEVVRYRPNIVLLTPSTQVPFAENDWVGRELQIGAVRLRGLIPIPRCAIPTLEHGGLPRSLNAVRSLLTSNRVDVSGFGTVPCAGLYAEVLLPGTIRSGDPATVQ